MTADFEDDDNPENPFFDITFENENLDEPTELTLMHHLDSGGLSIVLNGTEAYFNPDEWLMLLNWLQTAHGFRDWIDERKQKEASAEFRNRLKLFEQAGLQGLELVAAALLPNE